MATIERFARPDAARSEHAQALQRRLRWGARWVASFRGDSGQDPQSSFRGESGRDLHSSFRGECSQDDLQSSVRPEDLARSQVFYDSTLCWV